MKVSVIISACDNRKTFFKRSLDTWVRQTCKDFEIVIVDDDNRLEYIELCKEYSDIINFQYIQIDKLKSTIPVKTFIPVLSNNIGIRQARGEIIVITGPETLQYEKNIEKSLTFINRKECGYGLVFKANIESTKKIEKEWNDLKEKSLINILQIPGSQSECLCKHPHPPGYLYFLVVNKKYILEIGGFDERFLGGLCAEDDDLANRMNLNNIKPVFENGIIGIHQNHSFDKLDGIHTDRNSEKGRKLWEYNIKLMKENLSNKTINPNYNIEWGNKNLIIEHLFFGEKK